MKFHPSKTFKFPKRLFGAKKVERSFRAEWCKDFKWLHYNVESDSAFCHLCQTAEMEKKLLASTKKHPAFLNKGFTYWKEATTAFQKHQASKYHREAVEALIHLPEQVQGDIGELLNKEHLAAKAHNRKMFLIILESIRFLARQGLPLRGHLSDADSNFIQILHFQGRVAVPEIEAWMSKKTNKYTAPSIQNECLEIMALEIVRQKTQSMNIVYNTHPVVYMTMYNSDYNHVKQLAGSHLYLTIVR